MFVSIALFSQKEEIYLMLDCMEGVYFFFFLFFL